MRPSGTLVLQSSVIRFSPPKPFRPRPASEKLQPFQNKQRNTRNQSQQPQQEHSNLTLAADRITPEASTHDAGHDRHLDVILTAFLDELQENLDSTQKKHGRTNRCHTDSTKKTTTSNYPHAPSPTFGTWRDCAPALGDSCSVTRNRALPRCGNFDPTLCFASLAKCHTQPRTSSSYPRSAVASEVHSGWHCPCVFDE